jgi:2,3-bisphosphoglycerate-dependent phosphoglycerate mutase
MPILIILRHGQSVWNLENRFTGTTDIDLTPLGKEEARKAGRLIKPYAIGAAFTSALKRSYETMGIILDEIGRPDVPIIQTASFNERNYGDLQGKNKAEMEARFGLEQIMIWRRSFEAIPPNGESLKSTYNRVVPYYQLHIEPVLKGGKNTIIVAHGNSLRALVMYLEKMTPQEIEEVNLETGAPRKYEFDSNLVLNNAMYL